MEPFTIALALSLALLYCIKKHLYHHAEDSPVSEGLEVACDEFSREEEYVAQVARQDLDPEPFHHDSWSWWRSVQAPLYAVDVHG